MKYREFETSGGVKVISGRNAEQNEELVKRFLKKNKTIMHSAKPGSPFSVIVGRKKLQNKDLREIAVFTAKHSRDWKKNKRDVEIHVFSGKDIYKKEGMKVGTFGVRRFKRILIKKNELEGFE